MTRLGFCPRNEDVPGDRFVRFAGQRPVFGMLYFNQESWTELERSIWYIVDLGKKLKAAGINPYWNVPLGGARQIEALIEGKTVALYDNLLRQTLAIYDQGNAGKIPLRAFWEPNLAEHYQSNAAVNRDGIADPELYIRGFRILAERARRMSPRFQIDWNTNAGRENIAPDLLYPGDDVVDLVSQDWYLQFPGQTFERFATMPFGLNWGHQFATDHGKLYGWSEFGMKGDSFAAEMPKALAWGKARNIWHHCIWDRYETIDSRVSDGTHPLIAAAYKAGIAA